MSAEPTSSARRRRQWVPALWIGYGAIYVLVFVIRGETTPAVATAALVAAVGIGLAVELRRPYTDRPEQLGWTQDERQRLIHQKSMALVGYAAVAAAVLAGFVTFVVDSQAASWLMLGVLTLSQVSMDAACCSTGATSDRAAYGRRPNSSRRAGPGSAALAASRRIDHPLRRLRRGCARPL
jgi:hypothetical protein